MKGNDTEKKNRNAAGFDHVIDTKTQNQCFDKNTSYLRISKKREGSLVFSKRK